MPPAANAQAEVRLGLVLYGGVSLAIYMYGVVREILRLVRASQEVEENPYRDVLADAKVSVIVDIVSGTSAGGINGVLLAKALATGADIEHARKLWLDEGDIHKLLQPSSDPEPPSLLRSKLMRDNLARAFHDMDRQKPKAPPVRVLDLFVTGTHLEGRVVPFDDLLENEIETLDHRHTFHLKHRTKFWRLGAEQGWRHSDFDARSDEARAARNARLVQVARTTSAFPAAFQPELIEDSFLLVHRQPPAWFSDGGILQNRPFTQTIATIFGRTGDLPVRRCLVSVDPDPEQFGDPPQDPPEPTWLNVVRGAASKIPRYQSIAGDLERLTERNARVEDMTALLEEVDTAIRERLVEHLPPGGGPEFRRFLQRQVLYEPWRRMRRDAVAGDLAERFAGAARLDPENAKAVHAKLRSVNWWLDMADAPFELRRVYYVIRALPRLFREDIGRLADARALLWTRFERIRDTSWDAWEGDRRLLDAEHVGDDAAALAEAIMVDAALHLRSELPEIASAVRATCEEIERMLPPGRSHEVFGQSLPELLDTFEFRDLLILPMERLGDLGERDRIDFARISPAAAGYIGKDADAKVAGDTLGHFGGFLSREWRKNDILWGRLDAAEVLARIVLKDAHKDVQEHHIQALQRGIVEDELKEQPADYREYMREEHKVGEQTVNDLPPKALARLGLHAAQVFRNMLRTLERAEPESGGGKTRRAAFRYAGAAFGALLALVRWPAEAAFGEGGRKRFAAALLTGLALWGALNLLLEGLGVVDLPGKLTAMSAAAVVAYPLFAAAWRWLAGRPRERP